MSRRFKPIGVASSQGTLALVGGSHTSPITVASGASLGFSPGSPTTSTSSVNFGSGTVAKINGPAWLNIAPDGTLSGTPFQANVGPNSVTDGFNAPVQATLNIAVINVNDAPVSST